VFVGLAPDGTRQLYTRRLDQPTATALSGTTFGVSLAAPFFSPDGDWIGFITGNAIKKVSPQGGAVVQVADMGTTVFGASWGDDGNIIIGAQSGLFRVPSTGGKPVPLNAGALKFFPHVLPGARAVLINSFGGTTLDTLDDLRVDVAVIETGETKTLINSGYDPRYLPTSSRTGHLVYVSRGTLFAVAFDPERLEISGTPVPLISDVGNPSVLTGGAQFTFSRTGTFAYLAGRTVEASYPIQWLNVAGQLTPLLTQAATYGAPRLSPDGSRLAYTMASGRGGDVWVHDLQRDTPVQLTFTGPGLREVAWAPDSEHLVYGDGASLWWTRADGSGQAQRILEKAANPRPFSIGPDGRLVYTAFGTAGLPDLSVVHLDLSDPEHPKAGKPEVFLNEPAVEVDPAFSPDGKFLAYVTTELGPNEVFVRPYPGPGGKWKVSAEGGKFPVWSPTAKDLYFLAADDRIMVASYSIEGNSFVAGRPRVWSLTPVRRDGVRQSFDMSPDGKRAVVFPQPAAGQTEGTLHATFLLNFFDEVRRRIP
jgi:serine/threonine-protein kinase